jgi:hypothetical protein
MDDSRHLAQEIAMDSPAEAIARVAAFYPRPS